MCRKSEPSLCQNAPPNVTLFTGTEICVDLTLGWVLLSPGADNNPLTLSLVFLQTRTSAAISLLLAVSHMMHPSLGKPLMPVILFLGLSKFCFDLSLAMVLTRGRNQRPDVKFFCDVPYDPFVYMQENDKVYSECRMTMHSPQQYSPLLRLYYFFSRVGTNYSDTLVYRKG